MGILNVVVVKVMGSDSRFPHKWRSSSPANERILFASRICGHKKIVCICDTEDVSDDILAVMCHNFVKNMHSDMYCRKCVIVYTIRAGEPLFRK
jgi:hypothetical protein